MTVTAGLESRSAAAAPKEEEEPQSRVVRSASPLRTSERLWNLDWATILPWTIGEVTVELGTFEEILPFVRANYADLFGEADARFVVEEMTAAKLQFWADSDVFVFRRAGQVIGFWGGHPSDWSTYYCRSMSILPEFREGRLATELSSRICQTLAPTDVERIEVDTSVANIPMQRMLLGLGFIVTATMSSERWGAVLRFTKLLREDGAKVFARQFVNVPLYGKSAQHKERRKP